MAEDGRDLVRRIHAEHLAELLKHPPPEPPEPPVQELPDAEPGSPVVEEWNLFRRERPRLLKDGFKGKYALVKAGKPITLWDTLHDAVQAGELLYGSEALVHRVLPYPWSLRVGGGS